MEGKCDRLSGNWGAITWIDLSPKGSFFLPLPMFREVGHILHFIQLVKELVFVV
jgi:hypothetical protein